LRVFTNCDIRYSSGTTMSMCSFKHAPPTLSQSLSIASHTAMNPFPPRPSSSNHSSEMSSSVHSTCSVTRQHLESTSSDRGGDVTVARPLLCSMTSSDGDQTLRNNHEATGVSGVDTDRGVTPSHNTFPSASSNSQSSVNGSSWSTMNDSLDGAQRTNGAETTSDAVALGAIIPSMSDTAMASQAVSLTPVTDIVRFQETRYRDGGAHWYRSSAVLLRYHRFLFLVLVFFFVIVL